MTVTGSQVNERTQYDLHLRKILHSRVLRDSESLCKLLLYLGMHALNQPEEHLKEYQIATEALGRTVDFDPQSNSTVRVQLGRLRVKLVEYYNAEGADDPVLVDLPKGSYAISFHHRETTAKAAHAQLPEQRVRSEPERKRQWQFVVAALCILLVVFFALITTLPRHQPSNMAAAGQGFQTPAAYSQFWNAFVSTQKEPVLIFSEGTYVGHPETGMRYFDPARDSGKLILDDFTGVGEVLAVHALDQVFGSLHQTINVKRGRLFTLDDAQNNNLIFIGSPITNLTLGDLPSTHDFVFQVLTNGPHKGELVIINVHPQPNEPAEFDRTSSTLPLANDYAIISLVSGLNPARSIMILAGISTFGTEAAVEYVCRESSLKDLLSRLKKSKTGELEPFEAVIHVTVKRGVPVQEELVAVRQHSR